MDHYADDLGALTAHLNLKNAVHVGHSTGGGEVAHYLGRHGERRSGQGGAHQCSAAADGEDGGQSARPSQGGIRWTCRHNSLLIAAQFYRDVPAGPFYGYNRPGVKASEGNHSKLVASGNDGRSEGTL